MTLLEAKKTTIKLSDELNDLLRQIKNPLWARFIDPICRDAKVFDLTFKLPGLYLLREYAYNTTGGHPCNTFLAIESSVGCRIKEDLPSRTELLSVIEKAFSDFRDLETLTIEEKSLEKLVPCLIKSEETATYLKDLPEQDYLNKLVSEGLLKVYPDRRVTPAKNINSYKFTEMLNEVQQKQKKVAREWLNSLVRLPKKVRKIGEERKDILKIRAERKGNVYETKSICLGDKVSITELTDLIQDPSIKEDERREKLSAEAPFYYPLSAVATHTAIFGITGSGKSITTKRLVCEFVQYGVPVMIIDWHDEYVDIIRSLQGSISVPPTATRKPIGDEIPFTWNILDPRFYSKDRTSDVIEDYIGIVVDLLSHKDLMDLSEPMIGGLTETLSLAYKRDSIPTFSKVADLVEQVHLPHATMDALKRRLQRFSNGSLGRIFCTETSFNPQEIYTKPICVCVKHLTSDHRFAVGLLTYFILQQAESYFKRLGEINQIRHVIIVDEAPMVIGSNPKIEHALIRILQEIRKFGGGLVLVCRNPGISDDTMRETNQKIVHKLDLPKDVNSVSKMLGLSGNSKNLIYKLPRGVAFARIAGNPTTLIRIKAIQK